MVPAGGEREGRGRNREREREWERARRGWRACARLCWSCKMPTSLAQVPGQSGGRRGVEDWTQSRCEASRSGWQWQWQRNERVCGLHGWWLSGVGAGGWCCSWAGLGHAPQPRGSSTSRQRSTEVQHGQHLHQRGASGHHHRPPATTNTTPGWLIWRMLPVPSFIPVAVCRPPASQHARFDCSRETGSLVLLPVSTPYGPPAFAPLDGGRWVVVGAALCTSIAAVRHAVPLPLRCPSSFPAAAGHRASRRTWNRGQRQHFTRKMSSPPAGMGGAYWLGGASSGHSAARALPSASARASAKRVATTPDVSRASRACLACCVPPAQESRSAAALGLL